MCFLALLYTDSWSGTGVDPKRIMEAADIAQMVYAASTALPAGLRGRDHPPPTARRSLTGSLTIYFSRSSASPFSGSRQSVILMPVMMRSFIKPVSVCLFVLCC